MNIIRKEYSRIYSNIRYTLILRFIPNHDEHTPPAHCHDILYENMNPIVNFLSDHDQTTI